MEGFYFKNGYIHKTTAVLVMDKNPGEKKKGLGQRFAKEKALFNEMYL